MRATSFALVLLVTSVLVVHAAPTNYVPAVKAGDWAQYHVLYNSCTPAGSPTCPPPGSNGLDGIDYALLHVIGLTGTSGVTLQGTTAFTNGTITQMGISVDVSSGYSNVSTGMGSSPGTDYFVLAGSLSGSTQDPIWTVPNAPTLNSSQMKSVLGVDRSVNFFNRTSTTSYPPYSFSTSNGYAFDAQTGVFIEFSFEIQSNVPMASFDERFAIGMVDNNLWLAHTIPSDFSLGSDPTSITVQQGGMAAATVSLKAFNGFTGSVNLAIAPNLPSGITANFNHMTVDSLTTVVLSVTADSTAAPGSYTISVTGTQGSLTRPLNIPLYVIAPVPDFSISAGAVSPSEILAGSYGQSVITIAGSNGFNGMVTFHIVPGGLTCQPISPITGPGTVMLSCTSMIAGDYPAVVTATSIIGTTPVSKTTANIVFHITDFTISASPVTPSPLQAGSSASTTITLAPSNGFTGMVTLSTTGLSSGIAASFDHSTIGSSGSAVMTIAVSDSVGSGTYSFQVIGTDGTLSHHADVSINVTPAPDFTLAPSTSSLTLDSGVSGYVDVNLTPQGGFGDRTTLSYSISPSTGLTCNFDNIYVQGAGSARLTCSGTTPGSYTITVTGTAGNKQHSATPLTVTVKNASPNQTPAQPTKIFGLDAPVFYGTVAGVIAIFVVAGTVALMRARRKQTT